MTSTRRVTSSDGVRLAVYESGDSRAPTVVAVHGYPDNHAVWDGVAALLAEGYHVVTYDVRGTGDSDKPAGRAAYRIPLLVDDLTAVLEAVSPAEPVHLLGHDWGAIQSWAAVTDERLARRIATFTSISGPSLDHVRAWLRQLPRHPRASLRQLAHSYYIALFQLPWLPEAAIRCGVLGRALRRAAEHEPPPRTKADQLNGLQLYRANMLARRGAARPVPDRLPVQLIVPEDDAFVTPELAIGAARPWVADLTVRRVAGGHWLVSERPEVVAELVRAFLTEARSAPGV